jgi:hypothetical protein
MLTKIYPGEMYHVHEEIYNDFRQKSGKQGDEKAKVISIQTALFH